MPDSRTRIPDKGKGGKKLAGVPTVYWIGGAGLLVVAAVFYAHKKNQSASAANTDPTQGGTIDPATGVPYADEYQSLASPSGIPSTLGSTLGSALSGTSTMGSDSTQPIFTADVGNSSWATQAIAALEAQGYDSVTATTAVGLYMAGLPITQTQEGAISAAVAAIGAPPNAPTANIIGSQSGSASSTGSPITPLPPRLPYRLPITGIGAIRYPTAAPTQTLTAPTRIASPVSSSFLRTRSL